LQDRNLWGTNYRAPRDGLSVSCKAVTPQLLHTDSESPARVGNKTRTVLPEIKKSGRNAVAHGLM